MGVKGVRPTSERALIVEFLEGQEVVSCAAMNCMSCRSSAWLESHTLPMQLFPFCVQSAAVNGCCYTDLVNKQRKLTLLHIRVDTAKLFVLFDMSV